MLSGGQLLKIWLLDNHLLDTFGRKSTARQKIYQLLESSKSWLNWIRAHDKNIVNCSNPVLNCCRPLFVNNYFTETAQTFPGQHKIYKICSNFKHSTISIAESVEQIEFKQIIVGSTLCITTRIVTPWHWKKEKFFGNLRNLKTFFNLFLDVCGSSECNLIVIVLFHQIRHLWGLSM